MTEHEALIEALRFGPMAQVMRGFGWDERSRLLVCEAIAVDLLSRGWTRRIDSDASQENAPCEAVNHAD